MSKPHQCPVCLGKRVVPYGFYNYGEFMNTTSAVSEELCRSCNGEGIIWEHGHCCGMKNIAVQDEVNCTHSVVKQINGGMEQCSLCLKTWGGN